MEIEEITKEQKIAVLHKVFNEDIELFGRYFFPNHLSLETPEFHKNLYKLFENENFKRIAIAAPRGHAKSTITDLVFLAWTVVNKKANFILLISDTYSQAVLFLDSLKAEFESNDKLKNFYGSLVSKNWSEGEIIVNGIMIKALGAGMKLRGLKYHEWRPDLVIMDDLENDELVENKARREKLERWFNAAVIPSMQKDGKLIAIGTILHYDSLLYKLVSLDKYQQFNKSVYKAINDFGALWPEHLNLDELAKIKEEYIKQGQGYLFYQEYQNDPISDENRKFKLEKFKYLSQASELELEAKLISTFITIDRAYSTEKTADYTAIVVNKIDNQNNWHIVYAERNRLTEKELIDKIFDLKSYYNPTKIGIEQKAFKYTLEPTLKDEMRRRNIFFLVEELKDLGTGKNVRVEGLVPRFESGSIYIKKEQTDLIDELIKFPKGIHDDLIDALAYQLGIANPPKGTTQSNQYIPQNLSRRPIYKIPN
jgi:predicted phage terminase large subunit-like protein